LGFAENAFLYSFLLPIVFDEAMAFTGLSSEIVRQSLLCEYHARVPHLASQNAFRSVGHPFAKGFGKSAAEIIKGWRKSRGTWPLNQAYPDFALQKPFPLRMVFDAKYFEKESAAAAEKALVEGIHEVTFYRGLPATTQSGDRSDWGYDFGCLIAYDASEGGYLADAWKSVSHNDTFWFGANVHAIVVRGDSELAA
jgi:hypothetical protein